MFKNMVFDDKYKSLNAKQKEAVSEDNFYGPVMVVAGPGTGKTTILTLRIANILLKTDTKPDEILALTFTDSGARAMREKLRELIGDVSFRVNIFTFHGFANYIKGLYPENFIKIGERMPATDADKIEIIEDILAKQSFKELRVSDFGVTINKISGRISDLKRELVTPKDLQKILKKEEKEIGEWKESLEKINKTTEKEIESKEKKLKRLEEFGELYQLYEKELEKRAYYDFDDAILELIRALKENGDMRAEVRERFQFVLADEHQDANGAQNEILKLFKSEDEIDPPNIFVVGDDKQSIFRFQGASLEHFYNFVHEFPGAKKIVLEDNYRSQRVILDASHSLISRDGRVHQKLSSNTPHKEKNIEIVEYPDYESELADVAKKAKDIFDETSGLESVAIITKHNQTLFDIASYLEAEKVDFKIAGERSLFEDLEYQKLFFLLESICNPYEGRLLKALYAGYFNIPIHNLLRIVGDARKTRRDPVEILFANTAMASLEKIKALITKAKKTSVTEMLKEIRAEIYATSTPSAYGALRAVFEEARKLVVKKRSATLDDLVVHLKFLEKHHLAPLSGEKKTKAPIELLSVHRSKGLEYDHVFIINTTAKKFEGSGGRGDLLAIPSVGIDTLLEEERRLLYVAMTRAKKHVTISYALIGDKGEDNAPSALLEEIDVEFVDKKICNKEIVKPDLLATPKKSSEEQIKEFREAFLERNFSVSALNNFIECPWRYFFRNLLLVPDVSEFHSSLGNACHDALKIFHLNTKKGKVMNEKELKELASQSVHHEPFASSELSLALEKTEEYLLAYTKSFVPFSVEEEIYIEESFSFIYKVKDGDKIFEIPITGKIDLARENAKSITVIDFKTKKRMTRNAIKGETKSDDGDEMRQLQFYKFLLETAKPESNVALGVLTFLVPERGNILSEIFELTDDDKIMIENILKKALLSIYNFDFWDKTCDKKDCEYCKLREVVINNN